MASRTTTTTREIMMSRFESGILGGVIAVGVGEGEACSCSTLEAILRISC